MSGKSVLSSKECPARVSSGSVRAEVSNRSVKQECHVRASSTSEKKVRQEQQECLAGVFKQYSSSRSVEQKSRNSRIWVPIPKKKMTQAFLCAEYCLASS